MKTRAMSSITGMTACLALSAAVASAQISVRVNGEPVYFRGMGPQEINGRVMVPLRGVLEQMGADVHWNEATRTVIAQKDERTIELPVGSRMANVDGRTVNLDVPAQIMNGTTMVPLRFVGEALGADVHWNGATETVMIDSPQRAAERGMVPQRTADQGYTPADNYGPADQRYQPGRAHVTPRAAYGRLLTVPSGTVIPVTLNTPLSSTDNRPGDPFTATVVSGQDSAGIPDGTRVEGVVREAVPARNGKPGMLDMDIRRMVFPDGTSRTVSASLYSLDSKSIDRTADGRMVASRSNSNETLKWVGIGAGAGALLSTVVKGNTLLDTLLGAGAGYLYNQLQGKKPSDVRLGQGTQFGIRLNRDLAFRTTDTGSGIPSDNGYDDNGRYYNPSIR